MSTSVQERLSQAITEIREDDVDDLVQEALRAGMSPRQIMLEGLAPGLDEVGRLYSQGVYFLPELVMAGDAVKRAMDILDPLFASAGGEGRPGRVVIGTVQGDVHDIGKNMVITMLKGSGYEIIDLGVNVATPDFVTAVRQHRPDILALSALLLTTRAKMVQVINGLAEAGLRSDVRVLVGGCPVDQDFADQIGADGYGKDAIDAVAAANRLVSRP
jgi:5-methyltetrahydrofolate--homocysteine methyltransferase